MKAARILAVLLVLAVLGGGAWWLIGSGQTPVTPSPGGGTPAVDEPLPRSMITILPGVDDRLYPEPCNRFGVGGLYSVTATLDEMRGYAPTLGVLMGDVSLARGKVGQAHLRAIYRLLIHHTGVQVICPGEGELGHGAQFVRQELTEAARQRGFEIIGANVADALGRPLLKGWELAKVVAKPPAPQTPRYILFVSVLADSMQKRLEARGSDIQVLLARDSLDQALADGLKAAREAGHVVENRVLLVQGTVDEAAELLSEDLDFDFAVAARGSVLPEKTPRKVGGVQVFFAGRGVRFAWRVILEGRGDDSTRGYLVRLGQSLRSRGSPFDEALPPLRDQYVPGEVNKVIAAGGRIEDARGKFVGSAQCASCHPEIAAQHDQSAHAQPVTSLPALYGCAKCHTTGYDRAGGWRGSADTSDRASVSCESCHGPAERHLADPSKAYGAFDLARCTHCHLPDHTPEFDPEALWKRLGHRLDSGSK